MSLLQKYVSDVEGDGTYTLSLDALDTQALWDEMDDLERENAKLNAACQEWNRRAMDRIEAFANLQRENAKLRELLQQMLDVAENADETGYVADCGFIDLDKLHEKVRAAIDARKGVNPRRAQRGAA